MLQLGLLTGTRNNNRCLESVAGWQPAYWVRNCVQCTLKKRNFRPLSGPGIESGFAAEFRARAWLAGYLA